MPTYPMMQVDAFTDQPLGGNPCAVLFDTDGMQDVAMLAVAREMNLSETAFVQNSAPPGADFAARYFTPAEEIPLAGHPTLATAFALVASGRFRLAGEHTRLVLALKAGLIPVDIYAAGEHITRIVMTQNKPQFLQAYSAQEVLPAFHLHPEDALPGAPLQTVSTGTPQLMIPLRSLEALRRARVDVPAYTALRQRGDFFSPHLFCLQGATPAGQTFARHFGVPPDSPEDPFTGSATGGMAAYLWRYGLIGEPAFTAEQGHWMQRPGSGSAEVIGPPNDIQAVRVGGAAVGILEGTLML
jgi:trans-2,3-dihydro-3-hydroxyanthranilate isomerase